MSPSLVSSPGLYAARKPRLTFNYGAVQKASLERLKVLGRDPKDADALFSGKGINVLLRHGLDGSASPDASREALSCLANCMLLQPSTRSLTVQLGAAPKIADRYHHVEHHIDEFLCARLLLVMTYGTSCDFQDLIVKHGLCQSINSRLRWHSVHTDKLKATTPVPSPPMALAETLKLLFSLSKRCPNDVSFDEAVQPTIHILTTYPDTPNKPIDPIITHLVDALHVFPISKTNQDTWFTPSTPSLLIKRLVALAETATLTHQASEMDLKLSTTVIVLLRVHTYAPPETKSLICRELLPQEAERDRPLGQSNTLPSRLLRLSTSGYTPQLRELIPELFFELSDRNPEAFVNNVGYGYASGYLTNNNIPYAPPPAVDGAAGESTSGEGSAAAGRNNGMRTDVNPVTGQFLNREPQSNAPPMSEEEKLREAERLFVLFERLKATGVVDVKNPVEEALGRGELEDVGEGEKGSD